MTQLSDSPEFSQEQWAQILSFQGYGNPAGNYWFVGIEERGDGIPEELHAKLKYRQTEDLLYSQSPEIWGHSKKWKDFDPSKLIPTWTTMIRIVLNLQGDDRWRETERVREYQQQYFGKLDGETFLTDLLPLAKRSDADWPGWWRWANWEQYVREVLPPRKAALRSLFAKHQPKFVFCYGASYWSRYKELFDDAAFSPLLSGRAEMATVRKSKVVLTPFFAHYLLGLEAIDALVRELTL